MTAATAERWPTKPCTTCGDDVIYATVDGAKGGLFTVDPDPVPGGTLRLISSGGLGNVPRAVRVEPKLAFGNKGLHQRHYKTCRGKGRRAAA